MIAGAPGLFCCQYRTTGRSAPTELGEQLWAYDPLYGFSQEFPMSAALTKMVGVVEVATNSVQHTGELFNHESPVA